MNGQELLIPHSNPIDIEEAKDNSDEEYQVIQEDYHSSPRCGIKSRAVKKVTTNITFSPVEVSTKPYIKYCVTQIKEEQKNNNSDNLINNSNNNNINNNSKTSKKILKEKKEDNDNEENKEEKETQETNNIHIMEEKNNKIGCNKLKNSAKINKKMEKNHIKFRDGKNFMNSEKEIKKILSIKMKLNLNNEEKLDKNKENSDRNIYKLIPKNYNTNLNNKEIPKEEIINKDIFKAKSIMNIYSLNLKKDKEKVRVFSPKNTNINVTKEKSEGINMPSLFTTKNIKRVKKSIKFIDNNDGKKKKSNITRQHSFIPINKIKKAKIHEEKEKDIKKTRRHSLIPNIEISKENKKMFFNILNHNENKNKIKKKNHKHQKMKSLGEKNDEVVTFEKYKKFEKLENEACCTPKRRINCKYILKMDDSFKDSENNKNSDMPKTTKGKRKVSIYDNNNIESKKKRKIFTEEKKDTSKKKSIFCIFKEKDKDKNMHYKKDSEKKIKNKKTKRNKKKEKKEDKNEKDKKSNKNNKDNKNHENQKPNRKDKSFTILSSMNKNLINEEYNDENNNNKDQSLYSSKNDVTKDENNKDNPDIALNNNSKKDINISLTRRNSTRNLVRDNKPKITELTNEQVIENINEYTRYCLRIIPDLYDLEDKMPRCKTKVNPNFSKNKKIALFDLDETIVHCIGEINMNNLESLSKQSDAKIKVKLPGGKKEVTIGINIRPHWEEALNKIKKKYHIVAFTASHESYADPVLNYLDPNKKYFEYRLYRCHCVLCNIDDMKFYIKDLKILEDNYDLKDVVIIDNSLLSFAYHLDNGIPISPFYESKVDTELLDIADFLVKYANENDIRDKLKEVYKLNQYLEILKYYTSEDSPEISVIEEENPNDKSENTVSINKTKTNINLNKPLVDDNIKIDDSKDKEENNSKNATTKNISQINLKLKEIKNIFDDKDNDNKDNEEDMKEFTPKLNDTKQIKMSIMKSTEDKSYFRNKKRDKLKTIKFDINFEKEWAEKQKELKDEK